MIRPVQDASTSGGGHALRAHSLAVGHPRRPLLDSVTLSIEPGQCWFVLGPNGAGKSTLLATLAGALRPLAGRVELDGAPAGGSARRRQARLMALLPQVEAGVFDGTVHDFVSLGRFPWRGALGRWSPDDAAIIAGELAAFELDTLAGQPFERLSGGERQRARLAQLFVQRAPLMLIDEPFTHLDLRHQMALAARLEAHCADGTGAVCAVVHEFGWTIDIADRLAFVHADGRFECGLRADLLHPARLAELLGCPFREVTAEGRQVWLPAR